MGSSAKILVMLGVCTLMHILAHIYTCEHTCLLSCQSTFVHIYIHVCEYTHVYPAARLSFCVKHKPQAISFPTLTCLASSELCGLWTETVQLLYGMD